MNGYQKKIFVIIPYYLLHQNLILVIKKLMIFLINGKSFSFIYHLSFKYIIYIYIYNKISCKIIIVIKKNFFFFFFFLCLLYREKINIVDIEDENLNNSKNESRGYFNVYNKEMDPFFKLVRCDKNDNSIENNVNSWPVIISSQVVKDNKEKNKELEIKV